MINTILAVDDETQNLQLLQEYLSERPDCEVMVASGGREALKLLEENADGVDVILLDRLMPDMDGIEVMQYIKEHAVLQNIPVIMQTAARDKKQVAEGIEAGVYYYLTKPFSEEVLLSIIDAALYDYHQAKKLRHELDRYRLVRGVMASSHFEFCTLEEAKNIAAFISNFFPDPQKVVFGLSEMLINAVEHGNLGIGYQEKSKLNEEGRWLEEISHRLTLPEYRDKRANMYFHRSGNAISIVVRDEGDGFEWQNYLEISPDRAGDTHGRGIAMARMMSFDEVMFNKRGNEVTCTVFLQQQELDDGEQLDVSENTRIKA